MFPRLPARATFVADTNFVSGTQKMFLILFRNILCPQQMFPNLRSPRNIMGNNVSATMCPRLPRPLQVTRVPSFSLAGQQSGKKRNQFTSASETLQYQRSVKCSTKISQMYLSLDRNTQKICSLLVIRLFRWLKCKFFNLLRLILVLLQFCW